MGLTSITGSSASDGVIVLLGDMSDMKFVSLKYLCQRFSSHEIQRFVCMENNISVPFKFFVGVDLSILIENGKMYDIFCDKDIFPIDDV